MWLACSACCSTAVKPGQHADTRKGSTRSIFAAYDPFSVSLGVTIYQILQWWRELVLPIYSLLRIYWLRWSGHVCRMEDGRLPKDILYGQLPSAPRPVGRPKLRYKDVLKRALKALNINTENWEQLTLERAPWRSLLQDRRAYSIQMYITDCNRRRTDRRTRRERP